LTTPGILHALHLFVRDDHRKNRLPQIFRGLGSDRVKLPTGYSAGGATNDDGRLLRRYAAPEVQAKFTGGIRDLDAPVRVTCPGATRTSAMLEEYKRRLPLA
jgi:deoxyribose-phosphate aldolase